MFQQIFLSLQAKRSAIISYLLLGNYFSNLFTVVEIRYWKTSKFVLGRFLER